MLIRDAIPADSAAIAEIYNDAVLTTTAIWNNATVDADNRSAWMTDRQHHGYPVLVATDPATDTVLGYATYGPWRAFDGYIHTAEHSVYVRRDQRGTGIGKKLMTALIDTAGASDIHVLVAGIETTNTGSIRLHEKLGFEHVGHLKEVGTKFGRWLDLTFLQLTLDDRADNAHPHGRIDERDCDATTRDYGPSR